MVRCDRECPSSSLDAGANNGLGFIAYALEGLFLRREGRLEDFVEDGGVLRFRDLLAGLHFEDLFLEVLRIRQRLSIEHKTWQEKGGRN